MYNKSDYNLYQTLCKNIPQEKIPQKNIKSIVKKSKTFDPDQNERFIIIISEYAKHNTPFLETKTIPYDIKTEKDDTLITLDDLDNDLLWILYRFVAISDGS